MREKEVLKDLNDVLVLYQYLYMDPANRIVVDNGMAELEIRLDEKLRFYSKNMSFPHLPDMYYSEQMTLPCCLGIIKYLKGQKPIQFPDAFESLWDEIRDMTLRAVAMNLYN